MNSDQYLVDSAVGCERAPYRRLRRQSWKLTLLGCRDSSATPSRGEMLLKHVRRRGIANGGRRMKRWTIKDARRVRQWASTSEGERRSIEGLAAELARTPEAIKQFLRRELPPGSRPWAEKRRWQPGE